MKSKATPRFWKLYAELPAHVRKLARKNYALWKDDPAHPSLHFKKLKGAGGARFSVRIGDHYRAIGQVVEDCAQWVWIGTHEEYNQIT